jgi:hypothetical protein
VVDAGIFEPNREDPQGGSIHLTLSADAMIKSAMLSVRPETT